MGVVSAAIKFAGADWWMSEWAESAGAEICGIVAYIALIAYFILASRKVKD
mgnify:FL=1